MALISTSNLTLSQQDLALRDPSPLHKRQKREKNEKTKTKEKKERMQEHVPKSMSLSSNGCCISLLDYNSSLHLFAFDVNTIFWSVDKTNRVRRLLDMMELVILRQAKYPKEDASSWDILVLFHQLADQNPKLMKVVLQKLIQDHKSHGDADRHMYTSKVESLKSLVFRLMIREKRNFIDSQTRLMLYMMYDTLGSSFVNPALIPKAVDTLNKKTSLLFKDSSPYAIHPRPSLSLCRTQKEKKS